MRTLLIALALVLVTGCDAPVENTPASEVAAATAAAVDAAPNAAPAADVHGTWVADGATVIVSDEGVGSVSMGAVTFEPFTVVERTGSGLVLATADGTEYRFALDGDQPRLALSSRPSLTLTRR